MKARALAAIRLPAVAGTFYPAEPDVLERQLSRFLSEAANDVPPAHPKAIIGPHAGYAYSGAIAARCYRLGRGQLNLLAPLSLGVVNLDLKHRKTAL